MVLCTFISAPLMFISAKMISLTNLKPLDYLHELDAFSFDISIAGAAACCWMLTLLIVTKRFKRMPQRITACLVLSQVNLLEIAGTFTSYSHVFYPLVVDVLHWRHTLVEAGSCGTLAALFSVLPLQHWHIQLTLVDRSVGHHAALPAVP